MVIAIANAMVRSGDFAIDDAKLDTVTKAVTDAGIQLGEKPESITKGEEGAWSGWDGGVVWLVPTDRAISVWKPIAVKELR